MNNLKFKRVLRRKRTLAVELVHENVKALRGEPNRFSEALDDYYWFVHDAIYNSNAPQYFIEPILEDIRFGEVNESRLSRFGKIQDGVDAVAANLYTQYDNCEIRL